jgi:hypothetical protein
MLDIDISFVDVVGAANVLTLSFDSIALDRLQDIIDVLRVHLLERYVCGRGADRKISVIAMEAGHRIFDILTKPSEIFSPTDLEVNPGISDEDFREWFPENGKFDLEFSFWLTSDPVLETSENVADHIHSAVWNTHRVGKFFCVRMSEEGSREILSEALSSFGAISA